MFGQPMARVAVTRLVEAVVHFLALQHYVRPAARGPRRLRELGLQKNLNIPTEFSVTSCRCATHSSPEATIQIAEKRSTGLLRPSSHVPSFARRHFLLFNAQTDAQLSAGEEAVVEAGGY